MNKPVFFLGNLFSKFDLGRCDTCLFGLLKVKKNLKNIRQLESKLKLRKLKKKKTKIFTKLFELIKK
jgi:hypothetical protein